LAAFAMHMEQEKVNLEATTNQTMRQWTTDCASKTKQLRHAVIPRHCNKQSSNSTSQSYSPDRVSAQAATPQTTQWIMTTNATHQQCQQQCQIHWHNSAKNQQQK
jgi:hypothetical protein